VVSVAERLKACGLRVWIDEYEMTGDIVSKMCEAIEESATIAVFITQRYVQKVRPFIHCRLGWLASGRAGTGGGERERERDAKKNEISSTSLFLRHHLSSPYQTYIR
jgi:hypothetical protein